MKRSRAIEVLDHVRRHAIDRDVGADAEPAPSRGRDVADGADGQRIDVRVEMRMVVAGGMQAQSEDLLR
jgi:hypothetical protein